MKKLVYLLLIVLISMVTLSSASFAIILTHSNYLTAVTNWLSQQYLSSDLTIKNAAYTYPREFQFDINNADNTQSHVTFWLTSSFPESIRNISIDTILISDMDLSGDNPFYEYLKHLQVQQLSFKNVEFHNQQLRLHDANLQIKNPDWSNNEPLPYGEIQLQSEQINIGYFTLNNIILDADYYKDNSMIYGLSFKEGNASVSIQAQKEGNANWLITSLTASHLNMTSTWLNQLNALNQKSSWPVSSIERLVLLNSSYTNTLFRISNLSLSANNINTHLGDIRSQETLSLSASAEGISYAGKQWVEPVLTATVTNGKFHIDDFSAKLNEGYLNLSASLTDKSLIIEHLRAENIKYYLESENDLPAVFNFPVSNIDVTRLQVRNSQILQIEKQPYWQLSGVNIDADNVQVLKQGKLRLWNGSVEMSANNMSYGDIKGTQTILKMHSKNDIWSLDRFFSPLEKGYIELDGAWNYALNNGHWHLNMDTDSFPLHSALQYADLPVSISGLADISLHSEGLTGNTKIFSQTLSGNADISIRDGELKIPGNKKAESQPFTVNNLNISSQRGLITINQTDLISSSMTSTLFGKLDLDNLDQGDIQLTVKQPSCSVMQFNLLNPTTDQANCHQDR